MNKKEFLLDLLIAVILGVIFLFIDSKISLGIIVGYLFSILNFKLIELRYNGLETYNILAVLGSIFSIAVLAIPLVISFLIPNIMSYIGVFIGLMILRTRLIIEAFVKK